MLAVHPQAPADSTTLAPSTKPALPPTRRADPPTRPPATVTTSRRTPKAIASGRVLAWPRVSAATFYDVILWRDGKRVLDLWPSTPRVTLPEHWTLGGRRFNLVRGGYRWFVYPASGARASARYGPLAAHGTVGAPGQR